MNDKPVMVYVEDDPSSILVMKMIVERVMGIRTLTVFQDNDHFMEKVQLLGCIPDIFLLDIQMKPYNGFDMLRMLRAAPKFHNCKIVALTASVMNEEVAELQQNGFDSAIAKPLNIAAFPDLIYRIIQGESVWYVG